MSFDPIVSGSLSFLVVLILMALNVPIGISMLVVGFTGFALITGFEQALFVLGTCLLYTSDAADDLLCVDLGGRRIIKINLKMFMKI